MAYAPRLFRPHEIYFITSRTIDGAFFLRPSAKTNNAIGSILADAQERYEIELFDFVFLSNHMHLAARSTTGHLPEFMQYLKANVAGAINRILGRHSHLWERRYAASPILDEGAQVERAVYIYGHGVKEGLVERAEQWPGVVSLKQRLSGVAPIYQRFDQAGFTRARFNRAEPPKPAEFRRAVSVTLSPWPVFEGLGPQTMRAQLKELVHRAQEGSRGARRSKPAIGVKAILAQDPWSRPMTRLHRTPKPLCHTTSKERRRRYVRGFSAFLDDYARASRLFRDGDLGVSFPRGSFPPRLPLDWVRSSRAGPASSDTARVN